MSQFGGASPGRTGQDMDWQGQARLGLAGLDLAGLGKAGHGLARHGKGNQVTAVAWGNTPRDRIPRRGTWSGLSGLGGSGPGKAVRGPVWHVDPWQDLAESD